MEGPWQNNDNDNDNDNDGLCSIGVRPLANPLDSDNDSLQQSVDLP